MVLSHSAKPLRKKQTWLGADYSAWRVVIHPAAGAGIARLDGRNGGVRSGLCLAPEPHNQINPMDFVTFGNFG